MGNIIRWYNQNRRKVLIIGVFIIIVGFIVYRMIYSATDNLNNRGNIDRTNVINTEDLNSIAMPIQDSLVTGNKMNATKSQISVIDDFITNCNSRKIEEAYSLVSESCKKELYPTVEKFKEDYYDAYFNGQTKNVKVENWYNNIYRIDILNDALATGKVDTGSALQDYIAIVKEGESDTKLNINGFIAKKSFNNSETVAGVTVKLLEANSYMDYEYYTFEVTNHSQNLIAIGNIQDFEASYVIDQNGLRYTSNLNETSQPELCVSQGQTKTIKIKYFNQYSTSREIKSLVLARIILNYEAFEGNNSYNNYTSIKFSL